MKIFVRCKIIGDDNMVIMHSKQQRLKNVYVSLAGTKEAYTALKNDFFSFLSECVLICIIIRVGQSFLYF